MFQHESFTTFFARVRSSFRRMRYINLIIGRTYIRSGIILYQLSGRGANGIVTFSVVHVRGSAVIYTGRVHSQRTSRLGMLPLKILAIRIRQTQMRCEEMTRIFGD